MKKIYVIQSHQIMPEFKAEEQCSGIISFAFTSLKKANEQMDAIHRMVDEGKFYMSDSHEVSFDRSFDDGPLRRVIRVNHSNGTFTMYSIHEVELNSGYGI